MDPREPPRGRRWLALLIALELAWGMGYVLRTGFVLDGEIVFCLWDDAMISMRYARNLASGDGLVWNAGGERVQGFSNPAVTLVMAGLHLLPVEPRLVSLLFQLVALALQCVSLGLLWRIARRIAPERPGLGAAAAAAFALCAPVQIWALQGSDSAFLGAWLLACLAPLAGRRDGAWPRGLPLALAVGVAIRPDATVFALAVILASGLTPGARARRVLGAMLPLAVVWAVFLATGWLYYGDPLPNTWYLKATGSPRPLVLRSGLEQLASRLPGLAPSLALAAFAAWRRRRDRAVLAAAACILAGLAYDVWTGGDWLGAEYASRYAVPVLPLLLLLAIDAAQGLLGGSGERLPRGARAGLSLAVSACLALAVGAGLALLASPPVARVEWLDPRAPTLLRAVNAQNFLSARFLREATTPDTSIAVHWAGVVPYFSERPAVDVLGRSDRHIARLVVDRFLPGHSKWDWDYVLTERRPDVFLETSRGLGDRDDFRAEYLEARSRDGIDFFVRRDALAKLLDPELEIIHLPPMRPPRESGGAAKGGL